MLRFFHRNMETPSNGLLWRSILFFLLCLMKIKGREVGVPRGLYQKITKVLEENRSFTYRLMWKQNENLTFNCEGNSIHFENRQGWVGDL